MKYKVVSMIGIVQDEGKLLASIGAKLVEGVLASEDEIIVLARDADAVIVGPTEPYTGRVIESLEKCKVISRAGIGCNNIDIDAATKSGIPVAYVPDASTVEVSDHVMSLLLSLNRRLFTIVRTVQQGDWQPGAKNIFTIMEPICRLEGQTLGLVGVGRIGSSVCKKAKVFGLKVIAYDPYVSSALAVKLGIKKVAFEELLTESDYISIHAPLTASTRRLFGLEQFRKMKQTAYLINTSRGGIVDEEALISALSEKYITGAGLDVTDTEPPKPDNPLLKMENVIITAHTAFYSRKSVAELNRRAISAVVDALRGLWPKELANPLVKEMKNRRLGGQEFI